MIVADVHPDSPLFGYVRPGYRVVSVNGEEVVDEIDFRYKTTDEQVDIVFASPSGDSATYRFDFSEDSDIGISFKEPKIKTCKCKCIFCFVHQQPKGMRRALYVKDEDYRLSFTHGNFITLSNTTREDLKRIVTQRLSPMYISVHTTDDTLRRCMLGNEKLEPILPQLQYLTEHGIEIHTQVVLCPEVNDGASLDDTITHLAGLYPGVQSLAVVPVGLTRYRERLPELRVYRSDEAFSVIDRVERRQREFLRTLGSRFVWPADEFYLQAGRRLPGIGSYEDMPQFENGVGMFREFLTGFNRRKRRLKDLSPEGRAVFVTGTSAGPVFRSEVIPFLKENLGLDVRLLEVPNRFWGETVTVSGLLTGQDILRTLREKNGEVDVIVLPPNCLNNDDLFLDNLSLEQFSAGLNSKVVVGQYDLAATVREVFS